MIDLQRELKSIGMQCFVNYYEQFKNCQSESDLAKKLLDENPKATSLSAQNTRINCAKRIFQSNLQYDALKIITESNRMSSDIIKKAKQILEKMK